MNIGMEEEENVPCLAEYNVVSIHNMPIVYTDQYVKPRICYIILTCERYAHTRMAWQKKYCFDEDSLQHCYFLSYKMGTDDRVFGWDTADDYASCIIKYIRFFQNMTLDYDWYMFLDDDTFVYPRRAEQFVNRFDPTQYLYIGAMLYCDDRTYMDGGPGFVLSKPTYLALIDFIRKTDESILFERSCNGDLSMGRWLKRIHTHYNIRYLNDGRKECEFHLLRKYGSSNPADLAQAVTFHYADTEEKFQLYSNSKNI